MPGDDLVLLIDEAGGIAAVYDDAHAELFTLLGAVSITRASHVEPAPDGGWTADMSPVGGPLLGPFALRAQALQAEREWLRIELGL